METFSALLALCVGNSSVTGEYHTGQWHGVVVVVVILFPTEYKQCITAYMNNNIKNKTT